MRPRILTNIRSRLPTPSIHSSAVAFSKVDNGKMESRSSEKADEKMGANGNANAKPGRRVIPPPAPQSAFRQYVDRKVTVVMQIFGLI
jgi:hypothetical protein